MVSRALRVSETVHPKTRNTGALLGTPVVQSTVSTS